MNLFDRIKARATAALAGAANFIDRDKQLAGTQLMQGGLTNRAASFVGDARESATARNQGIANRIGDWQARNRAWAENTRVPQSITDPTYAFGSGTIRSQLGFTGAENLLSGLNKEVATYRPQTRSGQWAENAGYAAGVPLGVIGATGGSLLGILKNALTGAGMGTAFTTGGSLVNDGRLPTKEEVYEGAKGGAKLSWLFPVTSALTNQVIGRGVPYLPHLANYTDEAIGALSSGTGNQIRSEGIRAAAPALQQLLARNVVREMAETPLETLAMGTQEKLQGDERSLPDIYASRFLGDLLGNAVFGAGKTAASVTKPTFLRTRDEFNRKSDEAAAEMGLTRKAYLQRGAIGDDRPERAPETLADIIKRRQFERYPDLTENEVMAKSAARNYGIPEKQALALINRYGYDKAVRAIAYMSENKTPIRDPLAYAKTLIETDYFTKRPEKTPFSPPEAGDDYMNSLLASEGTGVKPPETAQPTKVVEAPKPQSTKGDIPLREAEKMPIDAKTVRVVGAGDSQGGQYAVRWIDKNGEIQATSRVWGFKEEAQKFADRLKASVAQPPKTQPIKGVEAPAPKPIEELLGTPAKEEASSAYLDSLVKGEPPADPPAAAPTAPPKPKTFGEEIKSAKTTEDVKRVFALGRKKLDQLEQYFKSKKVTFSEVVNDLEAGKKTKETKALTDWFNAFRARAEADGVTLGTIEDYFHRVTKERAEEIIANGLAPDSFGSVFNKPSFAYKREGTLTDYTRSRLALEAYMIEAMKNASLPARQKAELKLAYDIKKAYEESMEDAGTVKSLSRGIVDSFDVVGKIWEKLRYPKEVALVKYEDKERGTARQFFNRNLRSVEDRSRRLGDKFYNNFFRDFRDAERAFNKAGYEIAKLDEEGLIGAYQSEYGKEPPKSMDRDMVIARILNRKYALLNAEATNNFLKNAAVADFDEYHRKTANDIFEEFVGNNLRQKRAVEKVMDMVRAQEGRGALGLNLTSSINNVLETRRIWAAVGRKNFDKGVRRVMKGENLIEKYGVDSKGSTALDRSTARKAIEKLDNALFFMFDKSERMKDNIALASFEEQGLEKGLSGKALEDFVIKKFDQYAIKYGKGQDIGLYRSPIFKTLFHFGQYPLKDLVIAWDKIEGVKGGDRGDAAYLGKYAFATILQAAIMKVVIGKIGFGDQTGTPLDVASDLSKGELPWSPWVKASYLAMATAYDTIGGSDMDEYEQDQQNKALKRSAGVSTIPAYNQLFAKTKAYGDIQKQGYQEKFGGNIANPASDNWFEQMKGYAFGPSYDENRQRYIDDYLSEGTGGLNKTQSAVFKALPRDQQQAFYDSQVAQNKAKAQTDKTLDSIGKQEGGFLQSLFGKKEEESFTGLFNGKKGTSKNMEERNEVFKTLDNTLSMEGITEEQRAAILKEAGVSDEQYEYYRVASLTDNAQIQHVVQALHTMPQDKWIDYLTTGRIAVAGRQLVTPGVLTYLYENDYISKDEKDMLNALIYDELNGELQFKKSYQGGSGSGKKASTIYNKIKMKLPNFKLSSLDAILKPLTQTPRAAGNNELEALLRGLNKPPQKQPSFLKRRRT